ncbi:DNA polymerase domain-containing protein [Amycolatopsis jiangsuensis]|uniref:DNA ligase D-like protein (Predicted polymerase) n=1 Tax=Amycolatopsis jiangsuensis TaxID=1181879 RepID=A0A840IT58_9PSEU|nr:ATP-dependent DNA ligase [Amycolatopsis jiangsuensis]MBB4684338.1 DNA ligase D-like protein (predicted polymerase) [Amycolatopsis jiangsuensis]
MTPASGVTLDLDGTELTISSPGKVYFPERGETKLDLVRYYQAVSGPLLDRLGGRPLLLERYPDGAGGKSWFQKRVPKTAPPWLTTTVVSTPNGTTSDALVAVDLAHVLWAVNQGCLGFHVWPNRADSLAIADELRIDLDPSPGIGFDQLREAAVLAREFLTGLGIEAQVKTSGSRGLHLYAILEPRWDGYQVRAAAVALARALERRHPELITAQWWKEERGSRVFVDFNQNAPHKTVFGAWCVRPRVGGQVSTPIGWDELATVEPDTLTLATVPARLADRGDPWAGANDRPQSLEPLLEMSRSDLANGLMDAPWPPVYPKMPNEPPRVAPSRAKKT